MTQANTPTPDKLEARRAAILQELKEIDTAIIDAIVLFVEDELIPAREAAEAYAAEPATTQQCASEPETTGEEATPCTPFRIIRPTPAIDTPTTEDLEWQLLARYRKERDTLKGALDISAPLITGGIAGLGRGVPKG